jgi:hypothetical protein
VGQARRTSIAGGEEVCAFLKLGSKEKPHAGRRSEYWRVWVEANGFQPKKRQTLSARVFKGKVFEVRLADVTRRFDGRDHPRGAVYTVVREIVRRTYP